MPFPRALLAFPVAFLIAGTALAAETPEFNLAIRNHRFEPAELKVPAGVRVKLLVRNEDATPEEFESIELDREKIVSGGAEIRVRIDPLKPGKYDYYGEFHMETAFGQIVAK